MSAFDAEIASFRRYLRSENDTLVIAEQTTKTHIGRILAKLNLRAQAVVLAYETGLVTPGGSGPVRTNPDTRPRH